MGRRSTGSIRRRGSTLSLRYTVAGQRFEESVGHGDERAARSLLAQRRREIIAGTWKAPEERAATAAVERLERELAVARAALPTPPVTLAAYLNERHGKREAAGVRGVRNEGTWWRDVVIPAMGSKLLSEVTRADVLALIQSLSSTPREKTGRPLSPRSILHVYRGLTTAFADAMIDGLVSANPCTLRTRRGELPVKRDRDPEWRASSVYSLEEAEAVLSDGRIPADRRTYYALQLLAGLRTSEAAGLRWSDVDTSAQPLGRLTVARQADGATATRATKTGEVRRVPIVPTLAGILEHWRTEGFPLLFRRFPSPSDPVVPTRNDPEGRSFRVTETMCNRLAEDLEAVGLRRVPHPQHAMRATFLSALEAAGANMGIARRATHRAPTDVVGGYLRTSWADLCREVAKLPIVVRPSAEVLALGKRGNLVGKLPEGVASALVFRGEVDGPSRGRTCTRPVMSGEL